MAQWHVAHICATLDDGKCPTVIDTEGALCKYFFLISFPLKNKLNLWKAFPSNDSLMSGWSVN